MIDDFFEQAEIRRKIFVYTRNGAAIETLNGAALTEIKQFETPKAQEPRNAAGIQTLKLRNGRSQ